MSFSPGRNAITVYEDSNFRGASATFDGEMPNLGRRQLNDNISAVLEEIVRLKPSSSKGKYVQKGAVSTTFGPGIPLDVSVI